MSNLVRRLRDPEFGTETSERNLMNQAADEIERLRAALHGICMFSNLDEDGKVMQDIARAALSGDKQ